MAVAEASQTEPESEPVPNQPQPDPAFVFLQSIVKMLRDDLGRRFEIDREMVHELREMREVHLETVQVLRAMHGELKYLRMKGSTS
jgi:hypothetical protein